MKNLLDGLKEYHYYYERNFYYVDKTQYIKMLENSLDNYTMILRTEKMGKTLFLDVLNEYYTYLQRSELFHRFKDTEIMKGINNYCMLRFDFSRLKADNNEELIKEFNGACINGIYKFKDRNYTYKSYDYGKSVIENMIDTFSEFMEKQRKHKSNKKIYVIIDSLPKPLSKYKELGYDSALKGIKEWYETLNSFRDKCIEKIFLTGPMPNDSRKLEEEIYSLTDYTMNEEFYNIMGFNKEELIKLMDEQQFTKEEQREIFTVFDDEFVEEIFSAKEKIYNPSQCIKYLADYVRQKWPND